MSLPPSLARGADLAPALSDLALCRLVDALYNDPAAPWDALFQPEADDGVCCALRRIGEVDVVVFRGSETVQDWLRDFFALPHEPANHPALGDVHAGFMEGMEDAFAHLLPLLGKTVVVTGHSLGAARATLFCGFMTAAGRPPRLRVVFGEPRSGCARLSELLAGVPGRSFRTAGAGRHDLVTDVPTDPPFGRVTALTDIAALPPPGDPWGIFAYHHIQLYEAALARLNAAAAA
ncbi:MAG TPA: lipase family protein [Stellaceae bacterium]|nr:lipase family protein [Stellaceae bacterium]